MCEYAVLLFVFFAVLLFVNHVCLTVMGSQKKSGKHKWFLGHGIVLTPGNVHFL